MEFPKLNFQDSFDFKITKNKDKLFIFDILRKTELLLTPEEWVRQHWIHHFIYNIGFAKSALISEKKVVINRTNKRIDLLVTEKTHPKILIECKAYNINLTEKTFEQVARYNSVIQAPEIILSNGYQHINALYSENEYQFYPFAF